MADLSGMGRARPTLVTRGIPKATVFGNAGIGIVSGPALHMLDASLMKDFHFSERKFVQVRWEAFNAFMRRRIPRWEKLSSRRRVLQAIQSICKKSFFFVFFCG